MCRVGKPLRRNSTYSLCVTKSPSFLMSFCCSSYFFANHCCFACVSFHIPVLPFPPAPPSIPRTSRFVPHFPFQNPIEHTRSRSLLQHTSPHPSTLSFHVLPFPPAFPLPILPFVPVLHTFVSLLSHFPSQNSVEHAHFRSSSSVLPSLHPFLP